MLIKRDGTQIAEVADSNEAFVWILKHQNNSVAYALIWDGYTVHNEDGTLCPGFEPDLEYKAQCEQHQARFERRERRKALIAQVKALTQ